MTLAGQQRCARVFKAVIAFSTGVFLLMPESGIALSLPKSISSIKTDSHIVQVASSSCSGTQAQLISAQLAALKNHNDYKKNPQPDWVVRRLALYESQLAALGCSVSSSSSSSSTSSSSNDTTYSASGGKVSWLSGMSCTDMGAAASWRGSPVTASVGWAPYKHGWDEIITYFSGGNMRKFVNAKAAGALPSIGLPMMPESDRGQFSKCNSGKFDGYFEKIASLLKGRGLDDIVLRLGWEGNLQSYPWIAGSNVAQYKSCFRRIVKTMRSVVPGLKFDWHNGKRTRFDNEAADLYPGDDVVDMIGLSYYDRDLDNRTQANWNESAQSGTLANPIGIEKWLDFAKKRGKKLSVAEWGITNRGPDTRYYQGSGDNDLFIKNMFNFFKSNSKNIAYESYFNCTGGEDPSVYILYPSSYNPKSSRMYQSLY